MNKDDCVGCANIDKCFHPCLYLQTVREITNYTNKPLYEMLAPPDIQDDRIHTRDYKELLVNNQQARQQIKNINISEIREIYDLRLRAIAAMLYADISQQDIARLLKVTVRRIRQIANC